MFIGLTLVVVPDEVVLGLGPQEGIDVVLLEEGLLVSAFAFNTCFVNDF